MTQRQYDKATAEALMQWAYSDYQDAEHVPYEIRDDGVYVNESFREVCPAGMVFDWTPADCQDGPEAPNPDTAPALPIPFAAADLAACMLDGVGLRIWTRVGPHVGSPIEESALPNVHPRMRWMRDALRDAYALAAEAQKVVGELDHAEQQSAHELLGHYNDVYNQAIERELVMERVVVGMKKDGSPEYGDFLPRDEYLRRLERAKASVSDLEEQANSAKAQANEKHRAWCGAMVRHLLNPEQLTASLAPVADSATMAPVVKETPAERRARWLAKFEAEEKREKRGALRRLADSEGVDRSNMSKDIAKARAERDTQRRAGGWASQLVQDGRRKR